MTTNYPVWKKERGSTFRCSHFYSPSPLPAHLWLVLPHYQSQCPFPVYITADLINFEREKTSSLLKHGFSSDESLSTFPSSHAWHSRQLPHILCIMIYQLYCQGKYLPACTPVVTWFSKCYLQPPAGETSGNQLGTNFWVPPQTYWMRNSLGARVQVILIHIKVWDPTVSPQRQCCQGWFCLLFEHIWLGSFF